MCVVMIVVVSVAIVADVVVCRGGGVDGVVGYVCCYWSCVLLL